MKNYLVLLAQVVWLHLTMASLDFDDPCKTEELDVELTCGSPMNFYYLPCLDCWRDNACDPNQQFTCSDLEYCVDKCDRYFAPTCHFKYFNLAKCEVYRDCGLDCQTKSESNIAAQEACEPSFGKRTSCAECSKAGDGVEYCINYNQVGGYDCDVVSQCLIDNDCLNCESEYKAVFDYLTYSLCNYTCWESESGRKLQEVKAKPGSQSHHVRGSYGKKRI